MISVVRQYSADLQHSLAVACALFERPEIARLTIVLLLAIHTGLLAYSAYVHSPTLNEPGHLVAGLSYWEFGRFDVYNVNPPLVKMVAALPVIAVGYQEDWSGFYTGLGARPEFVMGEDFVAANGERSFFLFMIARWACIPFSWLGGIVCYLWARDLFGRLSGVVACAIWCFEPNISAHASLITSDAGGAALGLAACYTFWRWLKQPTWSQAVFTGVVLGLAELTKTTLIIFYPLWPLMWGIYRWPERRLMQVGNWLREGGMLALRMSIGILVMNAGYAFEGSLTPLGEYQFVSTLFAGKPVSGGRPVATEETPQAFHASVAMVNRFSESWTGSLPIPVPKNYLQGIDVQQRDFEVDGRPSYIGGCWSESGWWYYYLYATAVKVPLGLLILSAYALAVAPMRNRLDWKTHLSMRWAKERIPSSPSPSIDLRSLNSPQVSAPRLSAERDIAMLILPPLIVLVVVSSKTGFSEHFRYILPCFPFVFVLVSGLFRARFNCLSHVTGDFVTTLSTSYARWLRLGFLLWSATSSLWIYPHSLSYFNELAGGPRSGHQYLMGSSLDWGQDLRYAKQYIDRQTMCRLGYCGPCSPMSFGVHNTEPIEQGSSAGYDSSMPASGDSPLAMNIVSRNFLEGAPVASHDGQFSSQPLSERKLQFLKTSDQKIYFGYSIIGIAD